MKTSIPPGSKSPTRKWPNSTFFATTSTENGTMQSSQDPQKQRDKLSTLPKRRTGANPKTMAVAPHWLLVDRNLHRIPNNCAAGETRVASDQRGEFVAKI